MIDAVETARGCERFWARMVGVWIGLWWMVDLGFVKGVGRNLRFTS